MVDIDLFDAVTFRTAKVSGVSITATTEGTPQTVVTVTTESLPAGMYTLMYAWQATFLAKDRPLYFKIGGTYADANFFSNAPSGNNELRINRLYGYPKEHAGGPITLSLEMYDPLAQAVVDFADVVVRRVD